MYLPTHENEVAIRFGKLLSYGSGSDLTHSAGGFLCDVFPIGHHWGSHICMEYFQRTSLDFVCTIDLGFLLDH